MVDFDIFLIAHRGLMNGPNKELENKPEQIREALSKGFHVEIDVWYCDGSFYLGHDGPETKITDDFFLGDDRIWIHAKNFEALDILSKKYLCLDKFNFFSHDIDKYVLTSRGFIWTYPDSSNKYSSNSVAVMPENICPVDQIYERFSGCYAICSDYVAIIGKSSGSPTISQ